MAKRIIVLEQVRANIFRYVLWADVPPAMQKFYVRTAPSAYLDATQQEQDALANGSITELVGEIEASNVNAAAADLQSTWIQFQGKISSTVKYQRYGTFWDVNGWTNQGIS